jgi:sugar lactone lactonase YvrE
VADIDRLVEIDIAKGTITNFYQAAGAEFLNDVAIGEGGSVYVSDMSPTNSVLYRLSDGKISPWLRGSEISRPNGLFMERDRLIVGNSGDGTLKALTLPDKTIESLAVTGAGIDGIASDGEGNYFISDWAGKTSVVKPSGDVVELLDTTSSHINSADITYIKEKNLLIIPTFFDNRIMAYEVLKK